MKYVLFAIGALVVLALIIFPDFRKKIKILIGGFLNVFVEDQAKTPEGAAAVFNQAISEKQEKYNGAATTLNKLAGELSNAKSNAERLQNQIKQVEMSCENLVRANKMEEARVYAERRTELMTELEAERNKISKLTPMVKEATEIHTMYSKELKNLQRNKKETVNKIKMNNQMKDLYGALDELRKDSATDKMLGVVLEGSSELEKEANGARIVHENRTTTKVARAEQKAAQAQSDEYLASITKKYNGGNN